MSFLTLILDSILPPRGSERLMRSLALEDLYLLASPTTGALPYHDPRITALVWEIKYRANKRAVALAGEFLSEQLLAVASEELGKVLLVPVPMHVSRRKQRGYNQTELLCRAVLSVLNERGGQSDIVDYAPEVLVRIKEAPPQQGLERHKRLKNVQGSMEVIDPERTRGRVCVVVDDVTTTGATLEEARRALTRAGARRVHFLTLAHS